MFLEVTTRQLIVDETVDGGMGSAQFARLALADLDGVENHGLGIEGEKSVGEQFPYAGEVFQHLGRLDGSQHTGNGSQHTGL